MRHKLLMCPPTYFGVDYSINVWMQDKIGTVNNTLALDQWITLYSELKQHTDVDLIKPQPGLPDMVFTANAGLKVDNKFFLSNFTHDERSGEEFYFRSWALANQLVNLEQSQYDFEGEGDCLRDYTHMYWMGTGFRTNKAFATILQDLGIDVTAVELVDPRFYHIDTCFCPFPDGRLMYYPGAFSTASQQLIENHWAIITSLDIIRVTEEEAATFCCNAVVLDKKVFMPRCESVADRLRDYEYEVFEFDMSEFQKSGGACKCLCLHIN